MSFKLFFLVITNISFFVDCIISNQRNSNWWDNRTISFRNKKIIQKTVYKETKPMRSRSLWMKITRAAKRVFTVPGMKTLKLIIKIFTIFYAK